MDNRQELALEPKTKPSISWEKNDPLFETNISVCKSGSTKIVTSVLVSWLISQRGKKVKQTPD